MTLKLELLSKEITSIIKEKLSMMEIDADKIIRTAALSALAEIQAVIKNDELSDFDAVEEIVCILEKYNIDFGVRHDF